MRHLIAFAVKLIAFVASTTCPTKSVEHGLAHAAGWRAERAVIINTNAEPCGSGIASPSYVAAICRRGKP